MVIDTRSLNVAPVLDPVAAVYSGITVKMMVDSDLGAELSTMFMVSYDPDGAAGAHDHPFRGDLPDPGGRGRGQLRRRAVPAGPGDAAWAGVGCVHSFRNAGAGPVRWLETQAPQPPRRHSYRFARDWEYLQSTVD